MDKRPLGATGMRVSSICFGGNVLGWTCDEPTSFAVLDAYAESGGDFIDTADVYSRWAPGHTGGESEIVLGRWMRARGNRKGMIVATKLGNPMGEGPGDKGLAGERVARAVEDSLRRLQTDYIDLYQAHIDDSATPLEETLRAFDALVKSGKVRAIGASNYGAKRFAEALDVSGKAGVSAYATLQPCYNLVERADYEAELEPLCRARGIAVIPYFSLAAGFLTGKYHRGGALPSTPRAAGISKRYMNDRGWAVLDAVEAEARRLGATPGQIAVAWLLARPSITAPIASATSVAQMEELANATRIRLDTDAVERLDRAGA
ncbi:MAG TPA: aldo/keto reductase [Methylomirabilota bacterium]|nr:aldo/keto reductase [Methylomirabilota bacterium]